MKILHKSLSFAALVLAMTLSSCTKQQSSLEIEDIKGEATIIGCLTYSEGQEYKNGKFVEKFAPATNRKIIAKVCNESFSSSSTGYTYYETYTDSVGKYEIVIPAVENNAQGTKVYIAGETFRGTFSSLSDQEWDERNPVFNVYDVIFSFNDKTVYAKPGDIKVVDAMYSYTPVGEADTFDEIGTIYGRIGLGKYYNDKDNEEKHAYWAVERDINVVVSVRYPYTEVINGIDEYMVRYFGATTNEDGEYIINIPIKDLTDEVEVKVKPSTFFTSSFTFPFFDSEDNYEWGQKTLKGLYEPYSENWTDYSFPLYFTDENEPIVTYLENYMVFNPLDEYKKYGYNKNDFYPSLPWGTSSFKDNN